MGKYCDNIEACIKCGSKNIVRVLLINDHLNPHDFARGKSNKMPGKGKPFSEFQAGQEKCYTRNTYVEKIRHIDRENDRYYERVSDTNTGEIIHECSERLSEHYGHGSARRKSKPK